MEFTDFIKMCKDRPVILIGASAGGIEALKEILPSFKKPSMASVVVVIHLPPEGPNLLPDLFRESCSFHIKESQMGELLKPETIYIAPPNYHLSIEHDYSLSLSNEEAVNFSRPSIDVLFDSAAFSLPDKSIAILLTGANHDGAQGLETLQSRGGLVVVQDPATAEYPIMPESALKKIRPDLMLDLKGISQLLSELCQTEGKL